MQYHAPLSLSFRFLPFPTTPAPLPPYLLSAVSEVIFLMCSTKRQINRAQGLFLFQLTLAFFRFVIVFVWSLCFGIGNPALTFCSGFDAPSRGEAVCVCVDHAVVREKTQKKKKGKNGQKHNSNNSNNSRSTVCRACPEVLLVQNATSVHNSFFLTRSVLPWDFTRVLLIDHVWVCLHAEQSFRM